MTCFYQDPVDEFGPGHPFTDQVALVDKAIRDCQSVSVRYQSSDNDDNQVYEGFRSGQPVNRSLVSSVSLASGTYFQVPSKYASVSHLISAYTHPNKSDVAGEKHPGLSSDTRFGVLGQTAVIVLEQQIRRETDMNRDTGVREHDERERQHQQGRPVAQLQHSSGVQASRCQRGNYHRQGRRGRRGPRDSHLANGQERVTSGSHVDAHIDNRSARMNNPANENQGSVQTTGHREIQPSHNHSAGLNDSMHHYQCNIVQHPPPPVLTSPILPPLGLVNFEGVPFKEYPQRIAAQIIANVEAAAARGECHSMEEILRVTQLRQNAAQIPYQVHQHTQSRLYDAERECADSHSRMYAHEQAVDERFQQEGSFQRRPTHQAVRDETYSHQHRPTAQRAGREYAVLLDDMNRQPPNPEVGHLRGDTFNAEFVLTPSTPTVLHAIASTRAIPLQPLQNRNQLLIDSHPVVIPQPYFKSIRGHSPNLNDSASGGAEQGIDPSRALLQPSSLANSGAYSRPPSPYAVRGRRLFESRTSSPGTRHSGLGVGESRGGGRSRSAGQLQ